MESIIEIDRCSLLDKTNRLVWLYSQAGYGKTTLMRQHYHKNKNNAFWLYNDVDIYDNYINFIKEMDDDNNILYIDDIHGFEVNWLNYFFSNLPVSAKVIVSSACFVADIDINLSILNRFQLIDHHILKFSYNQVDEFITDHFALSVKDIYELTLGWPVLVELVSKRIAVANDKEHLKDIVNSPPNSLMNFVKQKIINPNQERFEQFLLPLSVLNTVPVAIYNNIEQKAFADFCQHELNGFVISTPSEKKLIPLLQHACLLCYMREKPNFLLKHYIELSERFLNIEDIKTAIVLMLDIGEKARAISYLSRMGGLLEWIRHGLTNLIELSELFSESDIEQDVSVAWLNCIVSYKLGDVNKARQIIDMYKNNDETEQIIWTVLASMIKLNEGKIFDDKDFAQLQSKLHHYSEKSSNFSYFPHAMINNLLAVTWLQTGKNAKAQWSLNEAEISYRSLKDAQYAQTFIKIHQVHSATLALDFSKAKQLISSIRVDIQKYFNKDKSIKVALKIVQLEMNYLMGLLPSINSVDQLIMQLNRSESWFDSYATLYPIAIKLAILYEQTNYIPKWFVVADNHFQKNAMEYAQQLLSQLAQIAILDCPMLASELSCYVITPPKNLKNQAQSPWRIQSFECELMWKTQCYDKDMLLNIIKNAKENNNMLLFYIANIILELSLSPRYLSCELIETLSELKLIGLISRLKQYIPEQQLKHILQEHNRISLLDTLIKNPDKILHGLSRKEQQIHKLLAMKLRNKAIALELDISEQTVKFHLKNIYRKLGVKSRKEAALKITI